MKHIFIASVGGAPQVVTETLWALMHPKKMLSADITQREPVVPDEIIMLTTAFKGLGNSFESKEQRLNTTRDKINELYKQYNHTAPKINSNDEQVVRNRNEYELEDIRTGEENAVFADAVVRGFADIKKRRDKGEDITLHVSLAGGRKTMSSYLHAIMLLYGTERDELTHVLVENTNLESASDFWWPDQQKEIVHSFSARKDLSTSAQMDATGNVGDSARLDLVTVYFDPLGRTIPNIDKRFASFEKLIKYQKWERNGGKISFHRKSSAISVSGEEKISIGRGPFAILLLLATAKKEDWEHNYENQIVGLRGNILAHDVRYGVAHDTETKITSRGLQFLLNLFKDWEMEGMTRDYNQITDQDELFFPEKSVQEIPPEVYGGAREKLKKTAFDLTLGNLTREIKNKAAENYFPAFLTTVGFTQDRKRKYIQDADGNEVSTTYIGLNTNPDRIEIVND